MKKLLLFLFAFFSFYISAQLDREHWFAPMVDRVSSNTTQNYQSIYMSTGETTPFNVEIYHNNVVIATVTLSKNNPVKYSIQSSLRNRIITTSQSDLFKPVAKGFYLKGERPFFASLRFSINNHGEIQTSKGTAGLGTEFRAVMAPITVSNSILNFMNSIMATENNTQVTITDFQPNTVFSDFVSRSQITFTLNKGQSYIIDGRGNNSNNYLSYIGAKITSTKPIVIANGNFNGQYAGNHSSSSDILMDQGVPVDKLGTDFVLMKGNGSTTSGMEAAMIVAHENNTQIYLNNGPTPVATLNAGQFYKTTSSAYILQGGSHYNMYIHTSKNAYVYQLLAGDGGDAEVATGGFNYIPPLSCYLPKKIDEIGLIDQNEYRSNNVSYSLTVPTKLNIITEKGAIIDVKRNGVSLAVTSANGPYNVSGNNNWVTYSFPNISGNIAVFSTHAVTAGISAGNDAVGYGGYFAGFSVKPLITKTEGECLPGVKLEVTEGFAHYLWLMKVGTTYVPAPGVNNTFEYYPTQAGIYAAQIQQGSCPLIQTQDFKFFNCTTYTNYDYSTCSTETVIPQFALSTQALNPASVKIDTPPTKGTVTIAANGHIIYTANPNATGTDTFKFSFCGVGAIPDCETVQATIELNQVEKYDQVLEECSLTNTATFDLTKAAVTPDATATKVYYRTLNGAQNEIVADRINNFTNFLSTATSVYVRISNSYPCVAIAKIDLVVKTAAEVKPELYTKTHCDEDIDGKIDGTYRVNLTTVTPIVLTNPLLHDVKYFRTEAQAQANGTNNITGIFTFTADTSVWIRVDPKNGCPPVIKEILLKTGTPFTITSPVATSVCNSNPTINLNDFISQFTVDPTATVKFFGTLQAAQNNTPTVAANQTVSANRSFYYRFSSAGFCDVIGILDVVFKEGDPSSTLPPTVTVCEGGTTVLDVGTGYTAILWSTGETTQTITAGLGTYWVDLTNANGCTIRQNVTVNESPKPQWNLTAYNATLCDNDFDGIIKVNLNQVTSVILGNSTLFTVRYYLDENDALAGNNNFIPNPATWSFAADTTVYVRAVSTHCPAEVKSIEFKFGDRLTLIEKVVTTTVCDEGLNGTENINLATFKGLFTADAAVTMRYFTTLANAQSNTGNIPANQTITGDTTFYYRFTKAGSCVEIGTLNIIFSAGTPSTTLPPSVTVCEGATTILDVGTGYSTILWSTGATTQTVTVGQGTYWVDLTNASGCKLRQTVTIVESPKPQWNIAAYNGTLCDNDFDGEIKVNLTQVTRVIISNSTLFTVRYYLDENDALAGNNNFIQNPATWSFTTDTTVYVRASSQYCPAEVKQIQFKFGDRLVLIDKVVTTNICDNDLDGSANVNLATYRSLFTTETGVSTRYFTSLEDAQSNTGNIAANQVISGNTTYYYRFTKTGVCVEIGTLNLVLKESTPTSLEDSYTVCVGTTITLQAENSYTAWLWKKGNTVISTTSSATLGVGVYTVSFTNSFGCVFTKTITILEHPKPVWNMNAYDATHCDDDFDGKIEVKFSTITPQIITNHTLFTVEYFADSSFTNPLPNDWSYSTATTVYVRATSPYCPAEFRTIDFKFGNSPPMVQSTFADAVCDDDLDGIKSVNLANYRNQFVTGTGISVKYFATLTDAQQNINSINNNVTVTNTGTYYLRFKKNTFCDVIGTLKITIKIPKTSEQLVDQEICPDATTTLDAGSGFDSYKWSTGETTSSIKVPVGDYWVELTYDGCTYKQHVSVKALEMPSITAVEIEGSTVTVTVTGGNPPYKFSLDGTTWQDSNVFMNVPGGDHTVYVISAADNCTPVTHEITVIERYNTITPNGDGFNDVLNYSDLLKKEEPFLQIYDRYGKLLFTGSTANRFIWDGKVNGRVVSSGTYWYVTQWREPGATAVMKHNGWVLVKTRNNE